MNREILDKLQEDFPKEMVKKRAGRGGDKWDYIETAYIIQRLNDALEGKWSFEVVEHEQVGEELIVLGKLTAGDVVKMQFGGKEVEKYSKGSRQGEVISYSDNLKAAASDALKKCASQLGVALSLYMDEMPKGGTEEEKPKEKGKGKKAPDTMSLGELKGTIREGEKLLKAQGHNVDKLREEHLKVTTLSEIKDKEGLIGYLAVLRKLYQKDESE